MAARRAPTSWSAPTAFAPRCAPASFPVEPRYELNADVEAALKRYADLRGEFGRRCVARGRRLGAYIEARARPERQWSAEALDQRPERLLREIGATMAEIPELSHEV
ncbi:MAG: hypothetical protein ABR570_10630 [Burkholderiales bacterium]